MFAQKSYNSMLFNGALFEYKGVLHCKVYSFEEGPDETIAGSLAKPFSTGRMERPGKPNGFMLYGKLRVDCFSTSEMLFPNMKLKLRLTRAKTNCSIISDKPNLSLGKVDCSIFTRRIAFKDDNHKNRKDMLSIISVELN